ncbi:MAG: hypothetical protein ACKVQK_26275 [Burkholderiales bacterium]
MMERMAGFSNVSINDFGPSNKNGTITMRLFEASNELTSHVAYPHGPFQEIECAVRRGDYLLGKLYPDHVDFRAYQLEDEDFLGPNYVAVRQGRGDLIEALRKR